MLHYLSLPINQNHYRMKQGFVNCCALVLLAACSIFLSSCGSTQDAVDASGDWTHHPHYGPDYPNPSPDKSDFGLNIALQFFFPVNKQPDEFWNYNMNTPCLSEDKYFAQDVKQTDVLYASATPLYYAAAERPHLPTVHTPAPKKKPAFLNNIYIMGGPELVLKNSTDGGTKIRTGYLQLPVLALYRYTLPKKAGAVFGGLGPYFAYGLWGKAKSSTGSENIFSSNGFRRFDAGLSFTAGYQFTAGFAARLGYELGLADIDHDDVNHTRTRSFAIILSAPLSKLGIGK